MFFYRQQIDFILHIFLEILQGYCKLVIFGTLGMAGYAHLKLYYQFVENFGIYFYAKNFIPHVFRTIAKICELLVLGTLGMPGHTHPKCINL